jgi:hypothetical protein
MWSNVRGTIPYVSIRQHTSAYASIRQHTPAYVSILGATSGASSKAAVCNVEISGGAFVQIFVCVAGVFGCGVTHDFVRITHTYLCRDRVNGGEGGREGGCGE